MRPAYRTGSSREALTAARRTQLNRGLGLVLGVFGVYALASCFVPDLMAVGVGDHLHVGELFAAAQVLAVAIGVFRHDRHARRHVEPLAQRVVSRGQSGGERFAGQAAPATAAASPSAGAGSFDAFDTSRAFSRSAAAPRTARATS